LKQNATLMYKYLANSTYDHINIIGL